MNQGGDNFSVVKLPRFQRQMVDWLDLNTRHPVYMICEVDVTEPRRLIRNHRAHTGDPLSLTAYLTWCFAAAIAENRLLQAYPKGRRKIVIFNEIDIAIAIERDLEGFKIPLPMIIRNTHCLSPSQIDAAIREGRTGETPQAWAQRWLGPWLILPAAVRRFILRRLLANPQRRKQIAGTAMVSAAGMFGHGTGWGITPPSYSVSLLTGSIARKPAVVNGGIEAREILGITVGFDHDVVDGAVAARFGQRLKEIIEDCRGLEIEVSEADTVPAKANAETPSLVGGAANHH